MSILRCCRYEMCAKYFTPAKMNPHQIFCSDKCSREDWRTRKPKMWRDSQNRYANKPEVRKKRLERRRLWRNKNKHALKVRQCTA